MSEIFNNKKPLRLGSAKPAGQSPQGDQLSPAERKLLERIAEQLLEEHSDTLEKLGDE